MALIKPNPALKHGMSGQASTDGDVMTLQGTVRRTGQLLTILVLSAAFAWQLVPATLLIIIIAAVLAFIAGLVTFRKPDVAHISGRAYAVLEGIAVGVVSRMYNTAFDGIVVRALALTVAVLVALLVAYASGHIKVTDNVRLGIAAATGGVMLLYLVNIILRLVTGNSMSLLTGTSTMSIGLSLLICAIAAANLVVDFDFIETAVDNRLPASYEWVAATGLMVTLVWLYLEILRLLSKLRSRN